MLRKSYFLVFLLVVACSPLRGCVESIFVLDSTSRLPVYFALPQGMARADAEVFLDLWTNGDAEFRFYNATNSHTIAKKIGPSCWHPETHYPQNPDGTYRRPGGPEYIYVTIGGTTEVIEFNGVNNVFRMSDDSKLLQEARAAVSRHECRGEP